MKCYRLKQNNLVTKKAPQKKRDEKHKHAQTHPQRKQQMLKWPIYKMLFNDMHYLLVILIL